MPTQLTFDNATLSDAVARCARIAPTKGSAADKAAGILMAVDPDNKTAILSSTDLDVFLTATVEAEDGSGDLVTWRIPSALLNDLLIGLPKGDGHTITFIDRGDGKIRYKSGRLMAAFTMMRPEEFPRFAQFTTSVLSEAQALASRVNQVSWACDSKSKGVLAGVHLDGEFLYGASHTVCAVTPCKIPLSNPVTVALTTLTPLIKGGSDVRIAAEGDKFYLRLDQDTEAFTNVIQGKYPNMSNAMRTNFLGTMQVHKQAFLDTLAQLTGLIRVERMPFVTLILNTQGLMKMLTFDIEVPQVGRIQNSIDVATEFEATEEWKTVLSPVVLQQAIENCKGDNITISFGHAGDFHKRNSVRIEDASGYVSYLVSKED